MAKVEWCKKVSLDIFWTSFFEGQWLVPFDIV